MLSWPLTLEAFTPGCEHSVQTQWQQLILAEDPMFLFFERL